MKFSIVIASLFLVVACNTKATDSNVCERELGAGWWVPYAPSGVQAASNIDPDNCAPVANVYCCIVPGK